MKIIDFCKNYDDTLWQNTLDIIKHSNDDLKNNYLTLTPTDFVCWPVLVENDEIVCFSGLQINVERWSPNFARVNSRFYISPKHRHSGPGKLSKDEKFLNTRYLLSIQIEMAKDMGLAGVFMTREGNHKGVFELYTSLASRNTGYNFKLLDDRYNVCGYQNPVPESCKQWIALHCFNGDFNLWNKSMNKFKIIL